MTVYHLKVAVYSTMYGDLMEKYSCFSGVYSTLEKALNIGKDFIRRRSQTLYESSGYCTKDGSLTFEDFIKDDMLNCNFTITELDPEYADNYMEFGSEYKCEGTPPTHRVMSFDREGTLINEDWQYLYSGSDSGYILNRRDGDGNPDAGTKFMMGDLVRSKHKLYKNDIMVIYRVPKRQEKQYFENVYFLSAINNNKLCFCIELHEAQLEKFEGTLADDHPLLMLQKFYRGEIALSEETVKALENGEILLNDKPSWRDVIKAENAITLK